MIYSKIRRLLTIILIMLIIPSSIVGCYSGGYSSINKEVTLDNIQLEKLVEYKKNYVGD